jgi:hypothetical protein
VVGSVNTFRFCERWGISVPSEQLLVFQERLCTMEFLYIKLCYFYLCPPVFGHVRFILFSGSIFIQFSLLDCVPKIIKFAVHNFFSSNTVRT